MLIDKLINLFMNTEVHTFVLEYVSSKTLDTVFKKITKSKDLSVGEQLVNALSVSFDTLCNNMNWEHDEKAITETFIYSLNDVKFIPTKKQLKEILEDAMGQQIDETMLNMWEQIFRQTISTDKYHQLYKIYLLNSIQDTHENSLATNNDINDIKQYIYNQPKNLFNGNYDYALSQAKTGNYKTAIDIFMQIKSTSEGLKSKKITYDIGYYYLKWAESTIYDETMLMNAISYLTEAVQFIQIYNEEDDYLIFRNLARAHENLSTRKNKLNNYKNAERYILYAIDAAASIDNNVYDIYSLNIDLARIYENLSVVSSICDTRVYLQKAVNIYMDIINSGIELPEEQIFVLYHNIGRMFEKKAEFYDDYNDLDNAIEYYMLAENTSYASIENNPKQYALLHNNLGNVYFLKDSISSMDSKEWIEESLRHYKLALDVYSIDKNQHEFQMTSTNIGRVYSRLYVKFKKENDFILSKKYFEEVLPYRKPLSDPLGYAMVKIGIADLYIKKVKADSTYAKIDDVKYAHELLSLAKSNCKDALNICKKDTNEKMHCSIMIIYAQAFEVEAALEDEFECYQSALQFYQDVLKICNSDYNHHMFLVAVERAINCMINVSNCIDSLGEKYQWYLKQIDYLEDINAESYAFEIYYNTSVILLALYNQECNVNYLIKARENLEYYKGRIRSELDDNMLNELDDFINNISVMINTNHNS